MALSPEDIKQKLAEENPNALTADGFDSCLVGICYRFGQEPLACYDQQKCIEKLMQDGMSREEAIEFFEFNVIGSGVGETTPVFVDLFTEFSSEPKQS